MRRTSIPVAAVRRLVVGEQGYAARARRATTAEVEATIRRLGIVQVDSVTAVDRAHRLTLAARVGRLPDEALNRLRREGRIFEYWAHEASLLPVDDYPYFRRMMVSAEHHRWFRGVLEQHADLARQVLDDVEHIGPRSPRDYGGAGTGMWNWTPVKKVFETLWTRGDLVVCERRGFERIYDLPERVLPSEILNVPTPAEDEAQRELLRLSIRSLGIASERCLRDYFRIEPQDAKARIPELVEAGDLIPVTVEGWNGPVYLDPDAKIPRRVEARALVSPFDPIVWERTRTERLFDFRYRIEIYTPAEKREFGYYCLPFVLGEKIVARVDLKADRTGGNLIVHSIHPEAGVPPEIVAPALGEELRLMAAWLNLGSITAPKPWRKGLAV